MLTYEKYAMFRDSKNLKDGRVAELAGIGRSTFSDWKAGRSVPKEAKLRKIADALGISYAFMMGWDPEDEPSTESLIKFKAAVMDYFSEEEHSLIEDFRSLDEEHKKQLLLMVAFFKSQGDKK